MTVWIWFQNIRFMMAGDGIKQRNIVHELAVSSGKKVHIGDGIRFIEDANVTKSHEQETDGTCTDSLANGNSSGIKILIVDADSSDMREKVVLRLKAAFSQLFSLELEEDVNEVLFASPRKVCIDVDRLQEAIPKLRSLMKFPLADGQIEPGKFKCLK
ncbi:hypothetical protein B296_00025991 [Ensete ventricosum]|uniref:Uncharacterized protein n=1 Tax=Ensete ventricosum TaxID=4639 RepID=A0A427AS46_ENSVE|nr:hypothetical protein B296_00025991 [Ensete ventricosum]